MNLEFLRNHGIEHVTRSIFIYCCNLFSRSRKRKRKHERFIQENELVNSSIRLIDDIPLFGCWFIHSFILLKVSCHVIALPSSRYPHSFTSYSSPYLHRLWWGNSFNSSTNFSPFLFSFSHLLSLILENKLLKSSDEDINLHPHLHPHFYPPSSFPIPSLPFYSRSWKK